MSTPTTPVVTTPRLTVQEFLDRFSAVPGATASASVYRADELQQIFHNGDELTLPDVLSGFALPVSRLVG